MVKQIYIFSEQLTQRIKFTFELIFKELMNFENVIIISEISEFNAIENYPKLSYSNNSFDNAPFLAIGTNLLFEKGINSNKPIFFEGEKFGCFFEAEDKAGLFSFDLPAAVFWLVSRYEEYQSFEADKHGRFAAGNSFAFQNNFLNIPLVNIWVEELSQKLKIHFKDFTFPNKKAYSFIPSYDIDYAWAYRNKGFFRNFAAGVKDLIKFNFDNFFERIAVLSGIRQDPFYTFDYIKNLHNISEVKPLIFWLLGDYAHFDKNISYQVEQFRKLITNLDKLYNSGIHPSYLSNFQKEKVEMEIKRLESILSKKITKSRQHFLKLKFPDTYQNLLRMGITDDYTMGYAEQPGFRASIACSFYWYDLKNETQTNLRIHPFMLMDVTLHTYLKMSPEAALQSVLPIIQSTKEAGGELISIWHNNSFCEKGEWKGWKSMYEQFIEEASKK
jgi:hypothetical protein